MRVNKFKVKEGNREMEVIIPDTGDSSYNKYLEEAEREKTSNELKKNQRPERTIPLKETASAIKEYQKWLNDKKSGKRSKYY